MRGTGKPPAMETNPSTPKSQTTPFSNMSTNSLSVVTSSKMINKAQDNLAASSMGNAINLCESPENNKKVSLTTEKNKSFKFSCSRCCPFDTRFLKKWNIFNSETLLGLKRCSKEDVTFVKKVL